MKTLIEPFKIKVVEEIPITNREDREVYIKEAYNNPFFLKSDHITLDYLTDSGTTAMSAKQWSAIMDADEAYAGSRSYYKFESILKEITGFKYIIPTHQGRAAERILFNTIDAKSKVIFNNTHFDTTRGNIEFIGATAIDLPSESGRRPEIPALFKGNMDIDALKSNILKYGKENVAMVMITVTNNSGGGQPVSMENIKAVKQVCVENNLPFFIDCCRFAENAFFIKSYEEGYQNKTVKEIAQEMFSYADGCTMSAKKDGMGNTGGFIGMNDDKLAEKCQTLLIVTEGFLTYGGLARRDLEALAVGFAEVLDENYLKLRIGQVKYLGDLLLKSGVPILVPTGGHAVYLDAKRFASHIAPEHFPGQAISCQIYVTGGIRVCEIGSVMFGKTDENGNHIAPNMELVRIAIPRRVYTQSHIDYTAEVIEEVFREREKLQKMRITWQAEFLRHFTARFEYFD